MGTSVRWDGPRGDQWQGIRDVMPAGRISGQYTDQELTAAAQRSVRALHQTLRRDEGAFGLAEAAQEAGDRLVDVLGEMARGGAYAALDGEEFLARFTSQVAGEGTRFTDAAVRRAAVAVGEKFLDRDEPQTSRGTLSGDLLCEIYQFFFANLVAEFLRAVITTHVKLAFPLMEFVDPEDGLVGRVSESLVALVASPCEEAGRRLEKAEEVAGAVEQPEESLTDIARQLVPRSVRRVLGLVSEEDESEEDESEESP